MSYFYQKQELDKFFENHQKDKERIFEEIYSFLGNREFESKKDFRTNYIKLLSKEKDKKKELDCGLIIQIGEDLSNLELQGKNSTFTLSIDFMKKVQILFKKTNEFKTRYIISKTYFIYYYQNLKKNKIKYKFNNSIEEESFLLSKNFENDIIYNPNLEYISLSPDFQEIYTDIFNILKKEKVLQSITPKELFNEFRIINFPEINKEDINKIEFKSFSFNDYCLGYKYLCYNKKIGLTLATQKLLIRLFQKEMKYFYCNMDFLYKEVDIKKIRNYLFFYLSFLFSLNEQEKFQNFIEKKVMNLIYIYKGENLIMELLKVLKKKFKDNYRLYVDNVKSRVQLNVINKFMNQYGKEDVYILIQINEDTLYCLFDIQFTLIENNMMGSSISDDFEYYIPFSLGKLDDKKIKKDYSNKLQHFFEKFDYESYLYLLKVKYLIEANNFDIYKLIDIDTFLPFLIVQIGQNEVYNIEFRNNMIKEIFDDYYINYVSKFKNINNNIFHEITKTEEGINLERQITYDLIIKKMNITKIKIDKIFSIKSFPNNEFNKNNEYLFIQNKSNAPYYDIGYLFNSNGLIIFKACQIGINKPNDYLKKLDKEFILFDLSYFSQQLEFEKGIKIDKIQFCLITSFNAFEENEKYLNKTISAKDRKYANFNDMKEFCAKNNYVFLIFDTKSSQFYFYDEENNLKQTDLKYDAFQLNVKKIFNKNKYISITKRLLYNFNPDKPKYLGKFELPSNFNEETLNKEYKYKIVDNVAIYKKVTFSKKNDSIKDEDTELKTIGEKINQKNKNNEKIEEKISKKRPRDKIDNEKNNSKNKKKKTE